ncbi:PAS domain-containing sensor histidine kinase [Haloferax mediterranei ATCC 33500]|uniref:histidine kinase n=1 Tax=Haloferax mediterranei (strain ATCC 33500 / DSM 1411 / JCM 8866 / NBRC 14739 / NCIMB 2177 / R-4) TaxID=523841 RepID=I3R7J4_HALMT|nr:PAS domain-containing protein [Haloferax mediterranei]AFK20204.1 putative light- and oxygen-sensing transcription regulator [Haloferax mediterranei ATCC 33500]AHZ23579.1 transcriptional regulator [Haloferax mediterranei ATCC 33500]ELZ99063.1 putative light- and oxygen-sensing transcription regulator [Haloferax mediterranei ATCC 33500]MDX5987039.1 PAS domain-containing protein [Haloferax mediterranei ATCC 33500]QCQ76357.1 PAS domain-containing sensor histidine kinase [Haloferax mediterranei 
MDDVSLIERGFDELPAEVALLNEHGDIVYTNRSWRTFAAANGYVGDVSSIGENYLDVCDAASEDEEVAGVVSDGIRSILRGEQDLFTAEYPCHSPSVFRWFMLRAVPFDTRKHGQFALVVHLDITDRRLAELQVNEKNQHLALLVNVLSTELRQPLTSAIEAAKRLVSADGKDAVALSEALSRIDTIVKRSIGLVTQTNSLELEAVEFRECTMQAWHDLDEEREASFRIVGDGTLSADRHLFGLLLGSLLTNSVQRSSFPGYPTEIIVGSTDSGFYVDDDGPRPSAEERAATKPDQLLGVDYESMQLSVARRIVDLHGWTFEVSDSELGGARFEVDGVEWL